jgi:hypothetical protein
MVRTPCPPQRQEYSRRGGSSRDESSSSSLDDTSSRSDRRSALPVHKEDDQELVAKKLVISLILAMEGRGARLDSRLIEIIQTTLDDTARARTMMTELLEDEDGRVVAARLMQ